MSGNFAYEFIEIEDVDDNGARELIMAFEAMGDQFV